MPTANKIYEFFAEFIRKETGIIYKESNYYMLDGRLAELAKHTGFETVETMYQRAVVTMSNEMKLFLIDLATNNETLFFRDPNMYKGLEETITENSAALKELNRPLKIWSAACSFGQEAYSLAMTFEKKISMLPRRGYTIDATDISREALEGAKNGVYTQLQVQRGLPTRMLIQNFDKVADDEMHFDWRVKDFLKKRITFNHKNLLSAHYGPDLYDFIFCRNVLIYQSKSMKEEIINRLHGSLEPGGYLILGTAESLLGLNHQFEIVSGASHVFFRKKTKDSSLDRVG